MSWKLEYSWIGVVGFLVLLNEALGLVNPSGESIVHGGAMVGLGILGGLALGASKRN